MTELEELIQYWKGYLARHDEACKTETLQIRATIKYLEEQRRKIEEDEVPLKGIPITTY